MIIAVDAVALYGLCVYGVAPTRSSRRRSAWRALHRPTRLT
jgi:hypothetical protein